MKLYNLIIIICALSISGCNKMKDNIVYIKPIIGNDTLKYSITNLPENILYPGQVFICGDKFVIHQHKTDTKLIIKYLQEKKAN